MTDEVLKKISDMVGEAHAQIQQSYQHINPVVGVRQGMRDVGVPADSITIDCLEQNKRILIVLHDEQPSVLLYQFTTINDELEMSFKQSALNDVGVKTFINWMSEYFN